MWQHRCFDYIFFNFWNVKCQSCVLFNNCVSKWFIGRPFSVHSSRERSFQSFCILQVWCCLVGKTRRACVRPCVCVRVSVCVSIEHPVLLCMDPSGGGCRTLLHRCLCICSPGDASPLSSSTVAWRRWKPPHVAFAIKRRHVCCADKFPLCRRVSGRRAEEEGGVSFRLGIPRHIKGLCVPHPHTHTHKHTRCHDIPTHKPLVFFVLRVTLTLVHKHKLPSSMSKQSSWSLLSSSIFYCKIITPLRHFIPSLSLCNIISCSERGGSNQNHQILNVVYLLSAHEY